MLLVGALLVVHRGALSVGDIPRDVLALLVVDGRAVLENNLTVVPECRASLPASYGPLRLYLVVFRLVLRDVDGGALLHVSGRALLRVQGLVVDPAPGPRLGLFKEEGLRERSGEENEEPQDLSAKQQDTRLRDGKSPPRRHRQKTTLNMVSSKRSGRNPNL